MVVAEILTGIALVQKSVEFIKSNISTVQDISGIAKQIDGFFLGESQMNKSKGKGLSIAEQFGSVERSANDFIYLKLKKQIDCKEWKLGSKKKKLLILYKQWGLYFVYWQCL